MCVESEKANQIDLDTHSLTQPPLLPPFSSVRIYASIHIISVCEGVPESSIFAYGHPIHGRKTLITNGYSVIGYVHIVLNHRKGRMAQVVLEGEYISTIY